MSRVRALDEHAFAAEISKELGCDLYTKFIIDQAITGRVFLAEGEKGDDLIEDFKDLDSGLAVKRGHKTILQELRDSWLSSQAAGREVFAQAGETRDGGSEAAVGLQRGVQDGKPLRESMEGKFSQQVNDSGGGNSAQGRSQRGSAPTSPMTASKLFETLWHSKKYTTLVGKNGVRRLQSFHARVVSRVAADLGLSDYMPNEAKAKEIPSEAELTRLRNINLKKNPQDLEWRDKIFDSILEDDERGCEVTGLDGSVYKWPRASFNSTFTSIIDDLKKKLVNADRYRRSQAAKIKKYHDNKQKKVAQWLSHERLPCTYAF
ncbi:hypothetical protein KFL_004030030 [Klebsormidium nitens]|uniref:Uncharacterized protein n=1 Tax=Klebsormidium nitens TaxID=105231 RepID=A0A1Y1IC26_KLENI|nr:hypothetical protein KFL_004030030 [Klebsormidium nitens]|eukprot:GAQ88133.1 hypothetical protein KFL_004030030 [Klebsormidium nitens]